MKLVAQIQLMPDAEQSKRLRETVERFNAATNFVAGIAFDRRATNVFELRKLCYAEVRAQFGLSSQMAQLAIKAVSDVYKRDKTIKPAFRKHAAMPFDQRTMSFKGIDRVSLLTLEGRTIVPFLVGAYGRERLTLPKGQSDLVYRKGKWFLIVTVDVPDGALIEPKDFLGVDMGVAEIATDSDGEIHSGKAVERIRRKHNLQKQRLERKRTKGAKKKLKRLAGREANFRRHQNHVISKHIVEKAKGTERGIAVEELTGIRDRITAKGSDARKRLSGWSFSQLYKFLAYKAQLAGVTIIKIDPRNTSRTCAECGHCEKSNRKSRAEFRCKACGHESHADVNAARNIRARALSKQALELATVEAKTALRDCG